MTHDEKILRLETAIRMLLPPHGLEILAARTAGVKLASIANEFGIGEATVIRRAARTREVLAGCALTTDDFHSDARSFSCIHEPTAK